jgi:hypothetical protein
MPGPSFTERYVIARDSNVLRVDFARRPDPPAPCFPGAGALRPATRRSLQWIRASRKLDLLPTCGGGWVGGGGSALLCCHPLPVPPPQVGKGVAPDLVLLPSVVGLDLNPILPGSPPT